jgi:hypothetical protein
LKTKHGNIFADRKFIQKLDKTEAARTIEAYIRNGSKRTRVKSKQTADEQEHVQCKPYKCSICEYKSGIRSNTAMHIRRTHRLENQSANRLVTELPIDVARQTVKMYNEARARDGLFHKGGKRVDVYNHSQADTNLGVSSDRGLSSQATSSTIQNT